jgi:predicted Zn-dependent protease
MSVVPSSKSVRAPAATKPPARSPRWRIFRAFAFVIVLVALPAAVWLALRFDPFGSVRADFDRRRYVAALGAAEDYLKRWPGDPRASLMAARCATRIGQPARAEAHFSHAGTLGVDDLHDRAYGMIQMQMPRRAADLYGEILARDPDDALALKRKAAVLMGLKRYSRLPEIAARLMAIPGEDVAGLTLSGIGHHVDRQYPEAAEAFLDVLERDPDLTSMPLPTTLFWNHLATDLLAQGKFAEARTHLLRGLADTQDAGLTELLGTTYQQEGRPDEAERYWRLAVERDPNLPDAWLDLGNLAIARRRPKEAVSLLTRAAELAPDSVEAHQNLSVIYKMLGDPEQAERYRKITAELRARNSRSTGSSRGEDSAVATSVDERQR